MPGFEHALPVRIDERQIARREREHQTARFAGLQAIPEELYDAASIDGAGPVRCFFNITLPMLAPTLVFVTVITMIGYFQLFAEPYVMTQGGPGDATRSLVLLMYEQGFRWWNLGHAAAIAFVLFALVAAATFVGRRLLGASPLGAGA